MPAPDTGAYIHYWYAEGEEKERRPDIRYMKEHFPNTEFRVLTSIGHAGLAVKKPELFASLIREL
ncbi:MAG: hypothetical protein IJH51_05540 [Christensenellaceae bacterium]|nr:hypothetical protein [Christensenellaceae bacterium]